MADWIARVSSTLSPGLAPKWVGLAHDAWSSQGTSGVSFTGRPSPLGTVGKRLWTGCETNSPTFRFASFPSGFRPLAALRIASRYPTAETLRAYWVASLYSATLR